MTLTVSNMSCGHCEKTITDALKKAGYKAVVVDLDAKTVTVNDAKDERDVKAVIQAAGYTAT